MKYDNELFNASFTKRFGKSALIDLNAKPSVGEPGTFIATPAETLNLALSIGGVKKGAIVELYGPNSSGKTTLGLEVLRTVQHETGLPVMAIDAEHAFDKKYCESIGMLGGEMLKFNQYNETETVLNMVYDAVAAGIGAVLIDSIPALTPKAQLDDADVTDAKMGGNAKLLSDSVKRIKSVCSETGTIVIFINQIRSKVGMAAAYGNPETRSGGNALPFFADLIIRTSVEPAPDYLIADKTTGTIRGTRIKAEVKKLKWGPPLRIAKYDIIYGQGIDKIGSIVEAAINESIIVQKGSWFSFHGEQLGQGKPQTRMILEQDPNKLEEIRKALWVKGEL